MLTGLREGHLDLALMIQPGKPSLSSLIFEELRRYGVRVAVPPAHALAEARQVGLPALAAERLVGYTRQHYPEYHAFLASLYAPLGKNPPAMEEHESATSLIAAVESGRGVAFVPESFACFVGARLTLIPLHPAPASFQVGLVRRKGKPAPPVADFIAAAQHPAPPRPG
jgi:DNA-binding transcriptional LysR family regulator